MSEVSLRVNGRQYEGWERVRVTLGIESLAGGFELQISDRVHGDRDSWPIVEEDQCQLAIDGRALITGFVDRRRLSYDATQHSLQVSGRDRAAALVDCSAVLTSWEFKSLSLLALAQRLAKPFGVSVRLDAAAVPSKVTLQTGKNAGRVATAGTTGKHSGLGLPNPPKKVSINPGDSAFEVLDRACRVAGILPVSDGLGGIVLTRAGSNRADTPLVEGDNILSAEAEYDVSTRYRRYVVMAQHQASDDWFGSSVAAVKGEASDQSVKRSERVLLIRSETSLTPESAKVRAAWEAKLRAARGDAVTIRVQGWQQSTGALWPVNALVRVKSPRVAIDGEMLITQTSFTLDEAGTVTDLTLRRPDAYLPEPIVSATSSNTWKEIRKGV